MNEAEKTLSELDLADLRWAHFHLEHPSLAARLSSVIGVPIEQGLQLLPQSWYTSLEQAAEHSVKRMLEMTISGMAHIAPNVANDSLHRLLVMGTGAVGGFFGPLMLLTELPVTTALMLRSIADIAHSLGEDLSGEDARLACMQVFALGGRTKEDTHADTGYYGLRITLSLHFSHQFLFLGKTASNAPVPGGLNLIRAIASRFGVVVSDKAAAQLVPVAGAVSGALLNLVFMNHFQDIARGHFIVRRLERIYGVEAIKTAYESISLSEAEVFKSYSPLEGW
ncbi:MAG: EcsC family protein [Methylococcaceae bacterium]|nr:EcsC family protein [Methylococcaceae bacterium]